MAAPICEMWRSCMSRGLREAKAAAAAYSAVGMGISHPLFEEFYGGPRGGLGLGGALLLSPDRTPSSSPSSCCSPVDGQEGFPDVHAPVYIRAAVLQEEGRMLDAPASPQGGSGGGGGGGGGIDDCGGGGYGGVREQDRFLPVANISRIMKKAIPTNDKIAKDAKETVQECVSEFISFITSEVSDKCQREKRKTSNGDDLLWAMAMLGFEEYIEPLKVYLQKYRELRLQWIWVVARSA